MLKLNLTRQALRFLDQLPPKQFCQVARKIFSLMKDPLPPDSIEMKGYPFRRTDTGEYRIVYRVESDCLKVSFIGKRNDDEIYRQIKHKT